MTRKDYIAFAKAIKNTLDETGETLDHSPVMQKMVQKTADVFVADNPRFDRPKFIQACGG